MDNYIKYIQIPVNKILFDHYADLNLDEKSLIVLLRLIEKENEKFAGFDSLISGTTMRKQEVISIIQDLIQLDLVGIETKEIDNKWVEMYTFDTLYQKLTQFITPVTKPKNRSKEDISEVFQYIESLYGRALTPAEFERISEWISTDNYDTETIKQGVDMAFKNDVTSLQYVERILSTLKRKEVKDNYLKPKNWLDGES
ncbi:chromosome replication protein DnaD [Phocicoccus schoeneichii]|uniref:DNA replication protein DnaD n=1 Tax=Phocicoccus schoeneichii TaxID=1812261 RepID=A0A6V7RJE1_9BACL|nr:DnaD domain protein [Jeotgalicoccus schoeneichii]GGH47602.1 chromosome replication protein DnaD [Jeotgalicoccus schoeneichii]CAD2077446.1 DNA replication protein DnaD [Jeotgalicoccus schoeneichii]